MDSHQLLHDNILRTAHQTASCIAHRHIHQRYPTSRSTWQQYHTVQQNMNSIIIYHQLLFQWLIFPGAASVYIQSINWISSKSRLWLYFNVVRKSDHWQDINNAILLFFSAQITTFCEYSKVNLEYFCNDWCPLSRQYHHLSPCMLMMQRLE